MVRFVPLDSRRKSEEIAEQIRELAINRDLKSGERLPPERELAKQFNVSRTGLREALLLLESQGFVQIKRGRHGGAFVQEMHSRSITGAFGHMLRLGQVSIEQLLEARLGIELMLLGFAGKNARRAWIDKLEQNVSEAETWAASKTPSARIELLENLHRFHQILAEATNNPVFELAAEAIVAIISAHLTEAGHSGCVSLESVREHRAILEALKEGRVDVAQRSLEAHLKADSRRTRALLQQYRRAPKRPRSSEGLRRSRA
jgi:GntR family transcriptional repressor for pyruvate dehydrogenase complex